MKLVYGKSDLMFAGVLLCGVFSHAAEVYVNPGSSITNAMASSQPGDTVHVNAGTYFENVQINKSGASSACITLVANGAVVINAGGSGKALRIAASYIVVNGFECTNYLEGLNMRTAHIKVLNCNFHSGSSMSNPVAGSNGLTVNFDSAIDDIDIENSNFYFNDAGGADFGCNSSTDVLSNVLLKNCKFYSNNCAGGTDGIGIGHQGTKTNISLIKCQAYDNLSDGFDLDAPVYMDGCIAHDNDKNGGPSWGVGIKVWGHSGNPSVYGQVKLINCLSYNNTQESAGGGGINIGGTNSIIANCLVSGNNSYAGVIISSGASVTIQNTIFYNEHYSISADSDTSRLTFDSSNIIYNCASNGALSATAAAAAKTFDPKFVDPIDNDVAPYGNFRLLITSPAINTGVSVPGVTNDADGNARPSGGVFDIGPYEFQSIAAPVPVISSPLAASGTAGTSFSYTITASNSPTSFNAMGLPAGLSLNTATGVISGAPTVSGNFGVTLSATNSGGTGTATLSLTISAALPLAPVINSSAIASGTAGASFSYSITATNNPSSFNAIGLPAGLSVNTSSGIISGTPNTAGKFIVALSATNAGGTGTAALTLTIASSPGKARIFPRAGFAYRMTGGKIQGSNDNIAYTDLATISNTPTEGTWTDFPISSVSYRFLRYIAPNGGWGNVAEVEFYKGTTKLTGTGFGTPGSYANQGSTFDKALDGNTLTFFDGPGGDGDYVGIDTSSPVNTAPVIASVATAIPNSVLPGVTVNFTVSASDNDGNALSYTWNFGDGTTATGATTTHVYTSIGNYAVSVVVDDGHGGAAGSNVNVTVFSAVNSGGGSVGTFASDQNFSGGNTYTTTSAIKTAGVTNPAPKAVYQSERYGNFTYTMSNLVAGGAYTVRLHFAEIWWNSAGQRVFNVSINGTQVLTNFDIYAAAGGKFIALVESFNAVATTNGQIVIKYTTVKDNAKSSGIEIISAAAPSSRSVVTLTQTPVIDDDDSINSIDLGTVTKGQRFKIKLDSPETGTKARLHWRVVDAARFAPGAVVRTGLVGGRARTAGTYTFELEIKGSTTASTNTYTLTVVP